MHRLTESEARELTDRIAESIDKLVPLVIKAFKGRADKALGFATWADYCRVELRGLSFPVGTREERRETIVTMRKAGMSNRAVASAIGTSEGTVRTDLASAQNYALGPITGLNGKRYQSAPACKPVVINAEVVKSPLYFARVTGALVAEIDEQKYGPDDMTAEQMRLLVNLRDALQEFSVVWHDEEIASIALEEQSHG